MRRPALAASAVALLALAGCDFTPTLDVPLPAFEPALTVNGVLAADSTVEVRVTAAADPYGQYRGGEKFDVPEGATAELLRDGVSAGALRLASQSCPDYSGGWTPGEEPPTYECGAFVSDVVAEAGRTYTVRASAPGFPDAEATVTVPERVDVAVAGGGVVQKPVPGGTRLDTDLTVTVRDPPGPVQQYALVVVSGPGSWEQDVYCDEWGCRDSTITVPYDRARIGYTTTDPVLLAGARVVPATGTDLVTFTDETFDGTQRAFAVRAQQYRFDGGLHERPGLAGVWLASFDAQTFGAYQIAWFSGGEDNPFAEPANLPSNVVGGHGLLGAVTINEALLDE